MNHPAVIAAALLIVAGPVRAGDPFSDAALSPPDVKLYVHIEDAAAIRAALADRPIAQWLGAWLNRGQLPAAWQRLCAAAGSGPGALFDACMGRRVTLLSRGGEPPAWVLMTEVDPVQSAALLQRLEAQVLAPRDDAGLFQLPAHELLIARSARMVLIAPQGQPGLLYDVLPILARSAAQTLANDPAIAEGRRLGDGRAGVFVRHATPLGGWSVGVAELLGGRVGVRHASHFQSAPFRSRLTALDWDPAPIACLQGATFLAYIEPTDIAGGPFDAFVEAALGEPVVTSALGPNLGPRQITAVFDAAGLPQDPPREPLLPALARAYEVNDATAAWGQLDAYMSRLLPALNSLGQGAFHLEAPDAASLVPLQPRRVDAAGLARWLVGDLPGAQSVSICWSVVEKPADAQFATTPRGGWCVVASDPVQLGALAAALHAMPCAATNDAPATGPPGPGRWTSCGSLDGRRLAAHLGRWGSAVQLLAQPQDAAAVEEALDLLAEFAGGVQLGSWRLARPAANCLTSEAELLLAPPESAGPPVPPAAPGP